MEVRAFVWRFSFAVPAWDDDRVFQHVSLDVGRLALYASPPIGGFG